MSTDQMIRAKISAFVPWFGSKRTMAPEIAAELGKHSAYWELCCGSAAVLFAKRPSSHETILDLHGDLINLAMVLASPKCSILYRRVERVVYCEAVFLEAVKRLERIEIETPESIYKIEDRHISQAFDYLIASWIGRNGVAGTERTNYQMALRWTPGGGGGPTRWRNAVSSIPFWHERLRNVCILQRDLFEALPKIVDQENVAIYVDPPYFKATRGGGGGSGYLHDFEALEHERLASELSRFKKARVVVSYYDHEALDDLYGGWTKLDKSRQKNLHVQNRRGAGKKNAPEVLLINGPSFTEKESDGKNEKG